jgi:hypothetical protein
MAAVRGPMQMGVMPVCLMRIWIRTGSVLVTISGLAIGVSRMCTMSMIPIWAHVTQSVMIVRALIQLSALPVWVTRNGTQAGVVSVKNIGKEMTARYGTTRAPVQTSARPVLDRTHPNASDVHQMLCEISQTPVSVFHTGLGVTVRFRRIVVAAIRSAQAVPGRSPTNVLSASPMRR